MRLFPVTVFYAKNPDEVLDFSTFAFLLNEPLEGFDSFDVLLDMNKSDMNDSRFYPGFQHQFVGLLFY